MKNYEATCLFDTSLGEEKIDSIVAKFEGKIKSGKGELVGVTKWGQKKLSYTLPKKKKIKDAYYILVEFKGDKDTLLALEESVKYAEGMIRYRIICAKPKTQIPQTGSAIGEISAEPKVEVSPDILIDNGQS
jgi:ribosomal protein S6